MNYIQIYSQGLFIIIIIMSLLWFISIYKKNVSIVDLFWGIGFVILGIFYFFNTEGLEIRKTIVSILVSIWGIRLSLYLTWRNWNKGEDFRYQNFRKQFGKKNYWWISFFQTFLLQGILMWLISAPLLSSQFFKNNSLNIFDSIAIIIWIIGFIFEAGGDYQLANFKNNPQNKGKVLNTGLWKYSRHPNYFGDATIWWSFGLFSVAAGNYFSLLSSLLMTLLIIKISGVSLLEKTLKSSKPQYREYIKKTPAFFPWFPKK